MTNKIWVLWWRAEDTGIWFAHYFYETETVAQADLAVCSETMPHHEWKLVEYAEVPK